MSQWEKAQKQAASITLKQAELFVRHTDIYKYIVASSCISIKI